MFQATAENAAAKARLADALCALAIDQTATFAELNAVAGPGFSVQNGARHVLYGAIKAAEKASGCLFESVRGVGIKRLPHNRTPEVGSRGFQKQHRGAGRMYDRLGRVRGTDNEFDPTTRGLIHLQRSVFGAIKLVTNPKRFKRVADNLAEKGNVVKPIPPKSVLNLFTKKTG